MPLLVGPHLPAGSLGARPQPRLAGPSLALRPWTVADAPTLVRAYADPDIQRWHCRSLDDEEATELVAAWRDAWVAEAGASWAVVERRAETVLGRVGFRELDLADGFAELGYWVLPAARRRGVATAAVTTLAGWAFDVVGLQRIELQHSVANAASCRVAAVTGFTLEGTSRSSGLHADGWHDMHVHARLRGDGVGSTKGVGASS